MLNWKKPLAAIGLCLGLLQAPAAHADQLQDIMDEGTLRVGVLFNAPPYTFQGEDGELTGIDADVARLLGDALGAKVEFVQVTFQNRIQSLLSNKIDIMLSAIAATPERALQVAFTEPYGAIQLGVYSHKARAVAKGPTELSDLAIGVVQGNTSDLWVTDNVPDAQVVRFDDSASLLAAYTAGQVQAYAESSRLQGELKRRDPNVDVQQVYQIRSSPIHIVLRQGEFNLLHWIDTTLFAKEVDGTLPALREKWFGDKQADLPKL